MGKDEHNFNHIQYDKKVIIPIFADFGEKVIMSVDFATKVANLQEYVGNISVLINYGSKYRRRIWNYLRLFDEIIYTSENGKIHIKNSINFSTSVEFKGM